MNWISIKLLLKLLFDFMAEFKICIFSERDLQQHDQPRLEHRVGGPHRAQHLLPLPQPQGYFNQGASQAENYSI